MAIACVVPRMDAPFILSWPHFLFVLSLITHHTITRFIAMETTAAISIRNRKRPSPWQEQPKQLEGFCSFCQTEPAALRVNTPSSVGNERPHQQQFCLLHYYTTNAVQSKPENVSILNQIELEQQLPDMQSLFADVFLEVKQELSEEAARSFQATAHDPLAIIGKLHKTPFTKQQKPPSARSLSKEANGGGFIQPIPLPERLLRTQHLQAQKQAALVRRMEHASKQTSATAANASHTQRRKPTRKSIWNVMEDNAYKPAATDEATIASQDTTSFVETSTSVVCSSCGSNKVACLSSGTNRNNDSTKGEIWGSGSRDEIVMRYQCQSCGKTWNEQE
jgi:hypothetical protein